MTVPVLLPGTEFLVSLYPHLLPFFLVPDQLDFTATPVLEVSPEDGTPACTIVATAAPAPDLRLAPALDPADARSRPTRSSTARSRPRTTTPYA